MVWGRNREILLNFHNSLVHYHYQNGRLHHKVSCIPPELYQEVILQLYPIFTFSTNFYSRRVGQSFFILCKACELDLNLIPLQKEVYERTTKDLIESVIDGYNATVFAYGPTGLFFSPTILK